ncbi:MAG: IS1634 family transposase [Actinomycetota bacterium]
MTVASSPVPARLRSASVSLSAPVARLTDGGGPGDDHRSARIEALREVGGVGWITSLRAPAIRALSEKGAVQASLFDHSNLAEIAHPDYPDERLVACRNPALGAERARKREELLAATEAALAAITAATGREKRPLRGQDRIGVRVGRVLGGYKMAKHFVIEISHQGLTWSRYQERIDAEAALDGFYVIRNSVSSDQLSAPEVVSAYKSLSTVEADFRSLKTVDLEMRPIHHLRADRVRSHALVCMLACYLAWHLRRAWAELTFQDETPASRSDPVAPARRSQPAEAKASTKRTSEGRQAESFATLLEELATLTRNQMRVPGDAERAPLEILSTPTEMQRRAFELLETKVPTRLG